MGSSVGSPEPPAPATSSSKYLDIIRNTSGVLKQVLVDYGKPWPSAKDLRLLVLTNAHAEMEHIFHHIQNVRLDQVFLMEVFERECFLLITEINQLGLQLKAVEGWFDEPSKYPSV
ncbi:uncharacterized protein LAESUDRAFT_757089 [Laetiporus sulphureus 93-53]|uniref:Uncharacterized protein n=1 Tax=Laetiporus sulphureus 93-53 TaxID=1314785 RepID=A0A165FFQ4_9APHY|nr:uncharacterized protein LAESUDRAFT_757089 [Laetiporus sulphureus 93-53]KZT08904.1 hypothetical protein LAESUDRAFT_757089 [Laetiporus sulphureus 93-53]